MHESFIADELVQQAVAQARRNGLNRIKSIRVSLGKESHITGEALNWWFELAKENTIAEQASLEIEKGIGSALLLISLEGEEIPCPQV